MSTISVLDSFSEFPGLRHCKLSDKSGEEFYHTILNSAFKECFEKNDKLTINLDCTAGYASSFLDEAFGNLVYDFTLENIKKYVEIISLQEPHWKEMILNKSYVQWEERRRKNQAPTKTSKHEAWYRLIDNELILNIWEPVAM